MTAGELRKKLEGVADDVPVYIPVSQEFDGVFYSPCILESGLTQFGTDPDITEEDIREAELLNKEIAEEDAFMLAPCGFTEKKEHTHLLN